MNNLRIFVPLANNDQLPIEFSTGKELIEFFVGDDTGSPPRGLCIEADDENGKTVRITVPYDEPDEVFVIYDVHDTAP